MYIRKQQRFILIIYCMNYLKCYKTTCDLFFVVVALLYVSQFYVADLILNCVIHKVNTDCHFTIKNRKRSAVFLEKI